MRLRTRPNPYREDFKELYQKLPPDVQKLVDDEIDTMKAAIEYIKRIGFFEYDLSNLDIVWDLSLFFEDGSPAYACTNCSSYIRIQPLGTMHLTPRQRLLVVAHEVGHQTYETRPRQLGRDPKLWNLATDYAINLEVMKYRDPKYPEQPLCELIEGICYRTDFEGKSAEQIYDILLAEQDKNKPEKPEKPGKPGKPGKPDEPGGKPGKDQTPNYPSEFPPDGPPPTSPVTVKDGKAFVDFGGKLDIHETGEKTPEEREQIRRNLEEAVKYARELAERDPTRGQFPGSAVEAIKKAQPRADWRARFRQYIENGLSRKTRYDFSLPQKKSLMQGLIAPRRKGENPPFVAVLLDTSGSMDATRLRPLLGEVQGVAEATGGRLFIIEADTQVQSEVPQDQVARYLERRIVRGRGGSDFRPAFKRVAQLKEEEGFPVRLIIALTDGGIDVPSRAPLEIPTIFCGIEKDKPAIDQLPFGDKVYVP